VLFLDIVGYSKRSVVEQQAVKCALDHALRLALYGIPREELIVLDTGDGTAITFLSDIERPYAVVVRLSEYLRHPLPHGPAFEIRAGINIGPVKLITDINETTNVIGDGINVAQRIMSFATPNQLLVSSAYYEMMRSLRAEYAQAFSKVGQRFDKHARSHLVYSARANNAEQPSFVTGIGVHARLRSSMRAVLEKRAHVALFATLVVSLWVLGLGLSGTAANEHQAATLRSDVAGYDGVPMNRDSLETKDARAGNARSSGGLPSRARAPRVAPSPSAKLSQRFGRS
jgi:hypothetical protein